MIAERARAVQAVHQANIDRYRRLLTTYLTDGERQFVERRIAEEQEALRGASRRDSSVDRAVG